VSEKASLDLAQQWFDQGASVLVYKFPTSAKLPHNVMEANRRGGNTQMVHPIVMALARGMTPPPPVQLQSVPCRGFRCTMKRLLKKLGRPPSSSCRSGRDDSHRRLPRTTGPR
jgi:hypothetical protein